MSYLVLARKYRPKTFDEVAGQPAVAQTLKNALRMGRIAHAYLFSGPRGVGKTSLARILARCLCCEKGPTPDPCGNCARCVSIGKGSDLDVVEIDAASNRGIDDIRDLRERARVAPMLGKHKFYIVDEAHQLTNEAFNALLKILEEPPAHVLFVLATTEHERIPETIRSRCQWFEFRRVSEVEIAARLETILKAEGLEYEPAALSAIARAARGGMRDSQSLLDQVITHGAGKVTLEGTLAVLGSLSRGSIAPLLDGVLAADFKAIAGEVDRLDREGVAAEHVVDALLDEFAARMHAAATAGGGADFDRWLVATNLLFAARRRIREHDEPRLALELTLLRLARQSDALPLREAIDALRFGSFGSVSESAAAGPRASATDAATAFARIVSAVESKNAAFGAFLKSFRAVALSGDRILVSPLRAGKPLFELSDPRIRQAVADAANATLGRHVEVALVEDGAGATTGPNSTASAPGIVDRAIELFEGRRVE